MLLLFSEHISRRLEYITRFLLEDICGFELKITCDENEYQSFLGASLNYSNKTFKKTEIQFNPAALLFEESLTAFHPRIDKQEKRINFLLPGRNPGQWVDDPFASSFFLISRYEEYFPYTPGQYNSYEAAASISYKERILKNPIINDWAEEIKQKLVQKFPSTPFRNNRFTPIISIDIDQAYAFKYRGWRRNILSFIRNITLLNIKLLSAQLLTIFFRRQDPYDTYEYLNKMQSASKLPFIYFVNLGAYSKFDKNLTAGNTALNKLLNGINEYAPVGIHPSYFSNEQPEKFITELKSLENILEIPVSKSRQHYLKIKMPETYQHLLNAGITEDYSMGYGTQPGFRAGTCTPFNWFDLSTNKKTALKVYPITFMEGTFGEDLGMNSEEAIKAMEEYIDAVKKYNGYFLCIWHNQSVNDQFFWKGWKTIFEQMIDKLTTRL